jgi:hypothetical protein
VTGLLRQPGDIRMNFEAALGLLTIELDLQFDQENVGLRCANPTYPKSEM